MCGIAGILNYANNAPIEEEMLKHMEEYLEQLKAEAKGLEEHINKLKSADK